MLFAFVLHFPLQNSKASSQRPVDSCRARRRSGGQEDGRGRKTKWTGRTRLPRRPELLLPEPRCREIGLLAAGDAELELEAAARGLPPDVQAPVSKGGRAVGRGVSNAHRGVDPSRVGDAARHVAALARVRQRLRAAPIPTDAVPFANPPLVIGKHVPPLYSVLAPDFAASGGECVTRGLHLCSQESIRQLARTPPPQTPSSLPRILALAAAARVRERTTSGEARRRTTAAVVAALPAFVGATSRLGNPLSIV